MPKILGIDLGTTNSCMAIIEAGEEFGIAPCGLGTVPPFGPFSFTLGNPQKEKRL